MIESLLVANRGEIARRIIRTAKRLGIRAIAVYSEADADLPFVAEADEAVLIGPPNPAQSYRNTEAIIAAAKSTGAQAIHPGYGFLSENAEFARTVESSGLIWVGPGADAITAMGDKINARNLMAAAGVPVAPGTTDPAADLDAAVTAAAEIGYPVMVKAAAGGGGMGMGVAVDEAALRTEYDKVRTFAERMFGDGSVLLERYFPRVRHVEVQILGLADGRVVALGERECSVQRRNQKLVEESPSPAVSPELRSRLLAAAVRAGEAVGYRNAGTVECLLDPASGEFFFLEMNTRLQVEHPVTEYVYGVDLVEEQLRVAAGLAPTFDPDALVPRGHAIEMRINAEDPKRFFPGPGVIRTWVEPTGDGVRVDSGYTEGNTVTQFYDSLLAKLIITGATRDEVLERAKAAVAAFQIEGPKNNVPFFAELLDNAEFRSGAYDTGIVSRMR
ncbi:acetyl-CoA carboxylase biotin carboxylase subunit [Micromonospora parathelypteridis]|uniref:Acetyl-CoA carboxylase biotin carboxylase subunit n=1 Tax=Micromonospora parathelypteridis TaxID=1839617 RepID=A0A840VMZ1_9ACTN|nr:biotin carboxylase N-terminal domain-containing protein [Micromonospora parathelypteridis]MBB5478342.1 acetyl-CoA carboxylase biotin carboxylase subunit [Micromonospora parathelypteridis]GGO06726.1 acetyl-CoA carboxylase biotin carboxylase subunit [Micromonospora parathelypteridis]